MTFSRYTGDDSSRLDKFVESFETDSNVTSVSRHDSNSLTFSVDRNSFFARELAVQMRREKQGYVWLRDGLFLEEEPLKVVVEFR